MSPSASPALNNLQLWLLDCIRSHFCDRRKFMFFLLLLVNPIDNIMFHLIETKSFMFFAFLFYACMFHSGWLFDSLLKQHSHTLQKGMFSNLNPLHISYIIYIFLLLSIRSISSLCRICIQPINYYDRQSSDSIAQKIKLMLHVVLSCPEKNVY